MTSPNEPGAAQPRRGFAASLALALLPLAGLCCAAWLAYGLSWWSAMVSLSAVLMVLGLLLLRGQPRLGWRLLAAGGLLLLGPWLARIVLVTGSQQARLTTLPADSGPSLLSRLYPEPDGTLAAAGVLRTIGGLRDPQSQELSQILREAYGRTEPPAALFPTPAIATYLGLQSSSSFETIALWPPLQRVAPDGAVVFLHGYAGNFYVYCWEMAQAAAAANLLTLCPSLGADGQWWLSHGDATLRATLDYAHDIGMNRVYLAGLSNGATGASALAPKHQERLAGLVLISGAGTSAPPDLPVLVVQGAADQMMPAATARAYASQSPRVTYREVAGGHFVFLSAHERVRPLIAEFLSAHEKRATALPRAR